METNKINEIIFNEVNDNKTPSVSYLVFSKDNIIHSISNGWSDIQNRKTTGEKTTYNAFSVTKTFTSLAVMQLAERNQVDIDQPVKKYLPDFPYSSEITLRQLLAHTAGIPNPIPLSWIHLTGEHAGFNRDLFFKSVFEKNPYTKSKPNEKFSYSNLGYVLLGQLIEKITGLTYEEYVRQNIFQPLKLEKDELDFVINDSAAHAKGYHKKNSFSYYILGMFIDKKKYLVKTEGDWKSFEDNYVNGASYGGLIGRPSALAKFAQDLLKANSVLISDEYKKKIFTENYTENKKPTGMSLGWYCGQLNGNRYFHHAGGGGGFYCELRIYPDLGIGSVIMFNRTGMSDARFLDKIDKFIIEDIKSES